MTSGASIENEATICRVTCGWRLPHLDISRVRRFWRDVHSPAIARRAGIHEYRHMQYDAVRSDLFGAADIEFVCDPAAQLDWMSDVRYADQAGLDRFGADPAPEVKAQLLSDIDMLVDRSTTYLVLGPNGHTFKDESGDPAPLVPARLPTFSVYVRRRGDLGGFRRRKAALAAEWAANPGVVRVRLSLLEVPDLEAERASGYPITTHAPGGVDRPFRWRREGLRDVVAARSGAVRGDDPCVSGGERLYVQLGWRNDLGRVARMLCGGGDGVLRGASASRSRPASVDVRSRRCGQRKRKPTVRSSA